MTFLSLYVPQTSVSLYYKLTDVPGPNGTPKQVPTLHTSDQLLLAVWACLSLRAIQPFGTNFHFATAVLLLEFELFLIH